MSRYAAMFERLRASNEAAFGAFVMLGDPDLEASALVLNALVEGGADMVEVGIPFSDPIADGPVIQAAANRALAAGVRVADCFGLIADFRARHPNIPVGILTYANLVVANGAAAFLAEAAAAGTDSLLIADVPVLEAPPFVEQARSAGIAPVLIAASNTPDSTLQRIAELGDGYTYCVTRSGVTGTDAAPKFDNSLPVRLREFGAPPPVFGFGIASPQHVRAAIAAGAAGVICGSAIVDRAARDPDVSGFVAGLKAATRNDSAAD